VAKNGNFEIHRLGAGAGAGAGADLAFSLVASRSGGTAPFLPSGNPSEM